jgi:hypothetical protein
MMVEMSDYIIAEAHAILSREDVELPAEIESAPGFYVAEKTDKAILAFSALLHNGQYYKIGVIRFYQ